MEAVESQPIANAVIFGFGWVGNTCAITTRLNNLSSVMTVRSKTGVRNYVEQLIVVGKPPYDLAINLQIASLYD